MSRRMYECTTCGDQHASAWGAAWCCDAAAFNPADPDDNPDILLGED